MFNVESRTVSWLRYISNVTSVTTQKGYPARVIGNINDTNRDMHTVLQVMGLDGVHYLPAEQLGRESDSITYAFSTDDGADLDAVVLSRLRRVDSSQMTAGAKSIIVGALEFMLKVE